MTNVKFVNDTRFMDWLVSFIDSDVRQALAPGGSNVGIGTLAA